MKKKLLLSTILVGLVLGCSNPTGNSSEAATYCFGGAEYEILSQDGDTVFNPTGLSCETE